MTTLIKLFTKTITTIDSKFNPEPFNIEYKVLVKQYLNKKVSIIVYNYTLNRTATTLLKTYTTHSIPKEALKKYNKYSNVRYPGELVTKKILTMIPELAETIENINKTLRTYQTGSFPTDLIKKPFNIMP